MDALTSRALSEIAKAEFDKQIEKGAKDLLDKVTK